jgi:hypothetical protein
VPRGTGAVILARDRSTPFARGDKVDPGASYGGTVKPLAALTLGVVIALALPACTSNDGGSAASPAPSASPSIRPSAVQQELTARQRAQQLNALAPPTFDALYRLTSKGPRPDASVRMRTKGDRFRLDITRGRRTAVLTYAPRGMVSCQVVAPKDKKGRPERSCFLVSKRPSQLPELFDPEVQRLFRSTRHALTMRRSEVTVKRAGTWHAPHGLGPAECFAIRGKSVESGRYCYLSRPGPTIGLLAQAEFPSGTLGIRDVKQIHREGVFKPPVKPTQLPNS